MNKRNRIIAMIDFSEGSENIVEFTFKLAYEINAKLVFVHQIEGMVPALADHSTLNHIYQLETKEATEKLKNLTKYRLHDNESLIASPKPIHAILDDLKSNHYTDWVIGGLKKNSIIKQIIFGSTLVKVLEYTDLITLTIPLDKQILIPESLFIAVTNKYPLNELQLNTILSGLKSSLKKVSFFTILQENDDYENEKIYLAELQKKYEAYNPTATILKSNNLLIESNKLVQNSENSFIVLQEGSRTLIDEILRKYQTNEIIHTGNIPLIILAK